MSLTTDEEVQLALAALTTIGKIIEIVRSAHSGSTAPADALSQIASIHDGLAANDAQIDDQVKGKFGS